MHIGEDMRGYSVVVAACKQTRGIGAAGQLPWSLRGDMAYFKQLTQSTRDPLKRNAVIMGLKTFARDIEGHDLSVYCDNQNACYSFVRAGSKSLALSKLAIRTVIWCHDHNVKAYWSYIRTDLNPADSLTRADYLRDMADILGDAMIEAVSPYS